MLARARKASQSAGSLARRRGSWGGTLVRPSPGLESYRERTAASKPRAELPVPSQERGSVGASVLGSCSGRAPALVLLLPLPEFINRGLRDGDEPLRQALEPLKG